MQDEWDRSTLYAVFQIHADRNTFYFVCVLCIRWLSFKTTVLSVMWGHQMKISHFVL